MSYFGLCTRLTGFPKQGEEFTTYYQGVSITHAELQHARICRGGFIQWHCALWKTLMTDPKLSQPRDVSAVTVNSVSHLNVWLVLTASLFWVLLW